MLTSFLITKDRNQKPKQLWNTQQRQKSQDLACISVLCNRFAYLIENQETTQLDKSFSSVHKHETQISTMYLGPATL